jgi:hypothetical protein
MSSFRRRAARKAAVILIGFVSGCSLNSPSGSPSEIPSPTASTERTPSPPSSFTSPIYGYTIQLPGG